MNSRSCFRAAVIPGAAHDINLHRNAGQLFAQIAYFADEAMGSHGERAERYRRSCAPHGDVSDQLPETGRPVPPLGGIT
jgi:hypothetical protein